MEETRVYDSEEARLKLGMEPAAFKYHLYRAPRPLVPDGKVGPALFFYENTLNAFKARKRGRGRPPKENGDKA